MDKKVSIIEPLSREEKIKKDDTYNVLFYFSFRFENGIIFNM